MIVGSLLASAALIYPSPGPQRSHLPSSDQPMSYLPSVNQPTSYLPSSDLHLDRKITAATTAALPWMTGTSVNPLLRAAHLVERGYSVSLVLPWLTPEQQPKLFPSGVTFDSQPQQEQWIRDWLRKADLDTAADSLCVRFYPAIYEEFLGAVIQRSGVDITQVVPPSERDVAILDEPEHLNWYHHGTQWQKAYKHVVGVLHTNYAYYSRHEERSGGAGDIPPPVRELIMTSLNTLVCKAHVDVSIRLSGALDPLPPNGSPVCNVHGVRSDFLAVGEEVAALSDEERAARFDKGAYLLGKALWTKGYRQLFDQLRADLSSGDWALDSMPTINTYGSGRDEKEIRMELEEEDGVRLPVKMNAGIDHAHEDLRGYSVLVNPSTSEVLCTATAEALGMGKKVLLPRHPSNTFFEQFTNAIMYDDRSELTPLLIEALKTPPAPLTEEERERLSWQAATERLLNAARLPAEVTPAREDLLTTAAYTVHNALGWGVLNDYFRENSGATPVHATWGERFAYQRDRYERKQRLLERRRAAAAARVLLV